MQKYMPKIAKEIAYILNQEKFCSVHTSFQHLSILFWRSSGATIYIIHREDMLHRF